MLTTSDGTELTEAELLPGEGAGTRLMAFGAPWVGPWKLLQKSLDKFETEGTNVIRVNIDDHPDLADRWAVVSLPTFVVVVDGQERKRYLGAVAESELDAGLTFGVRPAGRTKMRRRR